MRLGERRVQLHGGAGMRLGATMLPARDERRGVVVARPRVVRPLLDRVEPDGLEVLVVGVARVGHRRAGDDGGHTSIARAAGQP